MSSNDVIRWFLGFLLDKLGITYPTDPFFLMYSSGTKLFPGTYGTGGLDPAIGKLIPVGILLAMIYVSKEMLEKTAIQNIDLEQIIKLFVKFLIAFALVNNIGYLLHGMNDFSNALYSQIKTTFAVSLGNPQDVGKTIFKELQVLPTLSSDPNATPEVLSGGVMLDLISLIISELLNFILQMAFGIILVFTSLTRAVKLGYKSIWAPIAVSNIIGYSTRNAAVKYLKDLLALFLQLPVGYLGYCVGMGIISTSSSIDILGKIILYFTTIVWVATSASISKELFT